MLGLGILSLIAVLIFLVARSAVISNEKTKAMGLADAAAKSVATWYAQILNYDAYSNRAIAANEIMIAQSATLVSWTQYAQTLVQNIGTVAAVIPAAQALASWINESVTISNQMAKAGASIETPMRSIYAQMLHSSQQVMHAAATPFAAQAMVNEVVWSGDSRFFGQLIPSSSISAFFSFSLARSGVDRAPLASLLQQSQDDFSRSRGFDQRLYLMPSVGCIPTSMDSAFSKLIRRGGTWLSTDFSSWESADTLSIHSWRRRSWLNWRCSGLREAIPLAWGAADAQTSSHAQISRDGAGLGANPSAFSLAGSQAISLSGYQGLSGYRELVVSADAARQSASVRVPVVVRLPLSKTQKITAAQTVIADSLAKQPDKLWALSVAELFFQRPTDTLSNSATREFANLFAPFWGSRLVAPSAADQSVAMLLSQGVSP
jgi:hypothetical protein